MRKIQKSIRITLGAFINLIVCKSKKEAGQKAASLIIDQLKRQPASVLGLTADPSAIDTYVALAEDYSQNVTNWSHACTFNLGEYVGVRGTEYFSRRYFMDARLFTRVNVDQDNTHVPSGIDNVSDEPKLYEKLIDARGGIDLQFVELGVNGSVGFNYPGATIDASAAVIDIPKDALANFSNSFADAPVMPTKVVALGLKTIGAARKIVMLAVGSEKAEAVRSMLEGEMSDDLPCTMLRSHADITVITDKEAARQLSLTWRERWSKHATYNF